MQAGRELDVKVAEALGWDFLTEEGFKDEYLPYFSTSWDGMGSLVKEARRIGIYLGINAVPDRRYEAYAWDEVNQKRYEICGKTAPLTVCLVFLTAKGIAI
ncbi:hypothetical protein [Brevibacillus borstelensis]|uniref:hypothetical protein n=1 Tax=Brevibacillus borstelensis TaxID=45462 RepID=UPI0030C5924E